MIQEFVCPNGRMSVNGVCPIFEGDDGQVKDFDKGVFQFDFDKPTKVTFESANKIISDNINSYNSLVENKLGIPSNVSKAFTIGSSIATGSLMPFATSFITGAFLNNFNQNRIQDITNKDNQGDINILDFSNSGSPNPYGGGSFGIQSGMASQSQRDAGPGFEGTGSASEMGSF